MERAAVLGDGRELRREHLAMSLTGVPAGAPAGEAGPTLKSVAEAEREAIIAAYRHFRGQRRKVAEALGISERTLREKLRKLKDEGAII